MTITNEQLVGIAKKLGWDANEGYFLEGGPVLIYRMDGKPYERFWDPRVSLHDALELPRLLGLKLMLDYQKKTKWNAEVCEDIELDEAIAFSRYWSDQNASFRSGHCDGPAEAITRAVLQALEAGDE